MMLKVKKMYEDALLPKRATPGSSGIDLFAYIPDGLLQIHKDHGPQLIRTGVALEIPQGYEGQIRPRSSSGRYGAGVTLGTIDSDYRGEVLICIFVINGFKTYTARHNERLAQLVICKIPTVEVIEVSQLSETLRGSGGCGSTGR